MRIGPWVNVIGAECNSVTNSATYERLNPYDTATLPGPSITPGYTSPTSSLNWEDFDVSSFTTGTYCVFIQAGWWEYYWPGWGNGWYEIHPSASINCAGQAVADSKWNVFKVTGHTSGTFSVNVSQYLPHYTWYGSSFCP